MPKMKSHRGAAKRFRRSGSGKIMRRHAFNRHLLSKKSTKRKRAFGRPAVVSRGEAKRLKQMLPS